MSESDVRRQHGMPVKRAQRIADDMARRLQREFGGSYEWTHDTLHFQRRGASGVLTVTAREVQIRLTLGILLSPLGSNIEREIHTFLDEQLKQSNGGSRNDRPRPRPARGKLTRRSDSEETSNPSTS